MFDWLKSRLTIKKARQLVGTATTAIYSRQSDLAPLAEELTQGLQPFDQVRMFVAIQYSTLPHAFWSDDPSSDSEFLLAMFNEAEQEFLRDSDESTLEIQRLKAESNLMKAEIDFRIRELSFRNDPDSYDGIRYRMENELKRPISYRENEEIRKIAGQLSKVNAVLAQDAERSK